MSRSELHRRARVGCGLMALGALLGACGPDGPGGSEAPGAIPAGALRGELIVYTLTFDDGTSDDRYALRVGDRAGGNEDERPERSLQFSRAPELPSGAMIDVWGTPAPATAAATEGVGAGGLALQVTRWQPVRGRGGAGEVTEGNAQPLISGPAIRPRSFAFVLVDLGAGVNITPEEANRRLFGTEAAATPSVRQYFMEASYGRQDVAGQVFGPLKYTITGCDTRGLTTALRAMIPGTFDHYLWYLGSRISTCGWSGLASGGTVAKPSRDTWYNASAGCVVLVQEPGHNFGMRHSSSMKCPNASFLDTPTMVCTHSEYGDSYDPMGRGCRHMNGAQKAYLGWYGTCNVVEVLQSGSFTLLPTELPCDGTQVLQVAMPKTRPFFRSGGGGAAGSTELTHYYLELRAPIGIDKGLTPAVQIRVSADTKQANQRAEHTWFLDMNPATPALDGLVAGGQLRRSAGHGEVHRRGAGRDPGHREGRDHRRRWGRQQVPRRQPVRGPRAGTRELRRGTVFDQRRRTAGRARRRRAPDRQSGRWRARRGRGRSARRRQRCGHQRLRWHNRRDAGERRGRGPRRRGGRRQQRIRGQRTCGGQSFGVAFGGAFGWLRV